MPRSLLYQALLALHGSKYRVAIYTARAVVTPTGGCPSLFVTTIMESVHEKSAVPSLRDFNYFKRKHRRIILYVYLTTDSLTNNNLCLQIIYRHRTCFRRRSQICSWTLKLFKYVYIYYIIHILNHFW